MLDDVAVNELRVPLVTEISPSIKLVVDSLDVKVRVRVVSLVVAASAIAL